MRSEAEMNCIDSLNQFCFVFFSAYISEAETDTDDVASVVNQGCERARERGKQSQEYLNISNNSAKNERKVIMLTRS